ncbi:MULTISPECIES: tetratricopeptide repeat protein [unclassified Pseudomonas]|uniref:tetratricopeptide repeat protein n=1 Tax=unclassified Pseudomonas TaxID=196821 RepID=UPI001296E644|nr:MULTISPECIES: tetratricopeptide repeat protein [unclassified Pseudomonas]MQT43020.1 tetratricopeptide repeat protein [Pseudomonas sp. FSL R10-0765]MQT54718.1 tetratricopeptide repeat protein [Pseudomonas sp. FSL R10-2398]MQU01602.1 tetratricopeptide repeat protein [Pseudomonas sp. FSL R10-2245]MQU13728.1 tetratricopeptide repeat protein [Pseudomonas sp. FSL R10-2189]MQU40463.1 tetratricopeptide repeat protein [Pseudomonas sp. FSL R10-2172]
MKVVMAVCALLMLGGCATGGQSNPPWAAFSGGSCGKLSDDQELSMNLADDMAKEGKLHASLANLQNLPQGYAQVQLRKARIYRQLGRPEAGPLYRGLLGTCLSAEGDHGLGQLAAARGDNTLAASYLERAAQAAPTDEKIRNDLGVVYLNQLRTDEARFEFLTALELKQSDQLAALNLVTLLIYQDQWSQAAELASRAELTPEQVSDAQARAQALKTQAAKPASHQVAAIK